MNESRSKIFANYCYFLPATTTSEHSLKPFSFHLQPEVITKFSGIDRFPFSIPSHDTYGAPLLAARADAQLLQSFNTSNSAAIIIIVYYLYSAQRRSERLPTVHCDCVSSKMAEFSFARCVFTVFLCVIFTGLES